MTFTLLPNTAVGVGGLPSGTTMTALRDNTEEAAWITHTWQNVIGSRSAGTSYQNTTSRQILVAGVFSVGGIGGSEARFQVSTNNVSWTTIMQVNQISGGSNNSTFCVVVPNGIYYRVTTVGGANIQVWTELR